MTALKSNWKISQECCLRKDNGDLVIHNNTTTTVSVYTNVHDFNEQSSSEDVLYLVQHPNLDILLDIQDIRDKLRKTLSRKQNIW